MHLFIINIIDRYFRHEDAQEESRVERTVGNVTKETEITFEYGIRKPPKKHSKKRAGKALENIINFYLRILCMNFIMCMIILTTFGNGYLHHNFNCRSQWYQ